jgi:hypothetical protein
MAFEVVGSQFKQREETSRKGALFILSRAQRYLLIASDDCISE